MVFWLVVSALVALGLVNMLTTLFRSKKNIRDKVVLITGGAGGIGRELAFALAKLGCHLAIVDINEELGEKTVKDLKKLHSGVTIKFYKVRIRTFFRVIPPTTHSKKNSLKKNFFFMKTD